MDIGDIERAADAAHEAFTRANRLGQTRTRGAFAAGNLAETQICMGRWDEAVDTIRRADAVDPVSALYGILRTLNARVAVARGQSALATRMIAETKAFFETAAPYPHEVLPFAEVAIAFFLAEGDMEAALSTAEWAMAEYSPPRSDILYAWQFLATAIRACTDAPAAMAARAAELRTRLRRYADGLSGGGRVSAAYRSTFRAELAAAGGQSDPRAWESVTDAWEELAQPYPLAYARYRAAEAALTAGSGRPSEDRPTPATAAGPHLRRALELAVRLRARPLQRQIRTLARRAGINLDEDGAPDSPERAAARLGLTPRETEVLRLVAEGHSNREIAGRLFITTKTASVHVSNILAKLAVTSRGEAAAKAHRLQLFDTATH
jgi:DNA-binding CsgD family transcriptional regulator/tetratricopeptide (TPR) repeat protein